MWWAHLEAFYCLDAFAKDPIEAVELLIRGWENANGSNRGSANFAKEMVIEGAVWVKEIEYGMSISESGFDLIRGKEIKTISTDRPMFFPLVERLTKELENETD